MTKKKCSRGNIIILFIALKYNRHPELMCQKYHQNFIMSVRGGFLQPELCDLKDEAVIKMIAVLPPGWGLSSLWRVKKKKKRTLWNWCRSVQDICGLGGFVWFFVSVFLGVFKLSELTWITCHSLWWNGSFLECSASIQCMAYSELCLGPSTNKNKL